MSYRMKMEEMQKVIEAAKAYADDEQRRFKDEYGWADWMNQYTEAGDGEEPTEAEMDGIDKVLDEAWERSRGIDGYRMNEGRNAGYHYIFSDRESGEVLLEGDVTGGNKRDCQNAAIREGRDAGIKYYSNDNIKLYMRRNEG